MKKLKGRLITSIKSGAFCIGFAALFSLIFGVFLALLAKDISWAKIFKGKKITFMIFGVPAIIFPFIDYFCPYDHNPFVTAGIFYYGTPMILGRIFSGPPGEIYLFAFILLCCYEYIIYLKNKQ